MGLLGHDSAAQARVGRKAAVVVDCVTSGRGHHAGEASEQSHGRHLQRSPAVRQRALGIVKRTDLEHFSNPRPSGIIALGIEDGDTPVSVPMTDGTKDILLSTKQGMSIRFKEEEVRAMGRSAYGVKGITLEENDEVVAAEVIEPGKTILTVTENVYGKRTEESEDRVQGRGGKGIIDIKTTDRNGAVVGVSQSSDTDEIVVITNKGMLIRTRVSEVSVIGRNTQGVRMITLESADEKVSGIAKVAEVAEGLPNGDDGGNGEGRGGGDGNGAPDGAVEMPPDGEPGEGGEG
jgi:DNA gyrase subunit A